MQTYEQLTIFDYFKDTNTTDINSVDIKTNDIVYLIDKCEKIECTVLGVYRSHMKEIIFLFSKSTNLNYKVSSSEVGKSLFISEEQADNYIVTHKPVYDCINPEDVRIKSYVSFVLPKNNDEAFFCILDNGMIYEKFFFSIPHLYKMEDDKLKTYKRNFIKQMKMYGIRKMKTNHLPKLEKMYRCSDDTQWEYSTYNCPFVNGDAS